MGTKWGWKEGLGGGETVARMYNKNNLLKYFSGEKGHQIDEVEESRKGPLMPEALHSDYVSTHEEGLVSFTHTHLPHILMQYFGIKDIVPSLSAIPQNIAIRKEKKKKKNTYLERKISMKANVPKKICSF